jgi:hypothetical protein
MTARTLILGLILFTLLAGFFDTYLSGAASAGPGEFAPEFETYEPSSIQAENGNTSLPEQPFDEYFKSYFTVAEINSHLMKLSKAYPDIMKIEDLTARTPNGATWQGRVIWGVKISDNVMVEEPDEPKSVILGNIHAREWMAYEVSMYYIYHLVTNYGMPPTDNDGDGEINEDMFNGKDDDSDGLVDEDWSEARVTYLVNNREIWIIPTLNPDGTVYDHELQQQGSGSWRKNARDNNGNGVFDPDYDGVDLNRNFAYEWHSNQQGIISENGIEYTLDSTNPTSSVYRGPQDNFDNDGDSIVPFPDIWDPVYRRDRNGIDEDPWDGIDNDGDGKIDEDKDGGNSEPETQALDLLMARLDSDGNHHNMRSDVGINIAYHSVGGWVIWPWGHTKAPTQHEALIVGIGHEFMDMTGYASWEADDMYMVSGDSADYMYGVHGVLSYVIELNDEPGAGFHPPESLIINTSRKMLSVNLYAAEFTGVAKIAKENDFNDLEIGLPAIYHDQRHMSYSSNRAYKVRVEIENYENLDPKSVTLHYRVGTKGMYRTVQMKDTGEVAEGNTTIGGKAIFEAAIPAMPNDDGSMVYYYITAEDIRGLTVSGPRYGEGEPYNYKLDSGLDLTLFDAALAVFMAIIFIVIVWGGFFKGVHIAVKADRRK